MTRTQMTLTALAAVYLLALRGCSDIVSNDAGAYRLNRITGSVTYCRGVVCGMDIFSFKAPAELTQETKP